MTQGSALFEKAMRLVLLGLLLLACLRIVAPFLGAVSWAVILVVSTWPLFLRLETMLRGRRKTAALLMTVVLIAAFVVPVGFLASAFAEAAPKMVQWLREPHDWHIPEPPAWLAGLPLVGERLDALWRQSTTDLRGVLELARPILDKAARWLLGQGADIGLGLLEFLLAVIIAGILFAGAEHGAEMLRRAARRLGGERGVALLEVAGRTVRAVALGVIGAAAAQAVLATIGFAVAGVPAAAGLGFLCFLLAVAQLGPAPVWIPVAIWLGYSGETGWAAFTVAWGALVVNTVDNFIKPYIISQGARLPLLLIFVGVIGGLLAWGFLGIFLGATLLAVGWTLLLRWLEMEAPEEAPVPPPPPAATPPDARPPSQPPTA